MPTYEYGCTSCGQHVEVFQRITEDPLTTCGVCGGTLRKVFHPAGIVFKGPGFYATDNRSKPKSTSSSSSSSSSSSEGSHDDGSKGASRDEGSKGASRDEGSKGTKEPTKPKEKSA